ncbi:serine hydrolase domain-containing protein [Sphingomonas colocasiae]|uniref:Beta-lactamase family protein n=1 Tax=Sphingomonas colocasiae TaxID=1848973 RepID=A0ABS7PLM9_9SPHN|nr:serine hydrolase domain-containing protein [Sphingomonas colocasiae]MBY8820979.1 beta-lactamase family protein [Sphingomonas colocasiae]
MKRGYGAALLLALLGGGVSLAEAPVKVTAANADRLRQAGAEILFWSQAERDARFPHMETLFPGDVAGHSARPYPLPDGKPLDLGPGDPAGAYMAANNVAGLIVVQDGKVRLERYARGHSREGRYTSFSVAKSLTSTLVGAAVQDGFIASVDDPVTRYIPELAGSGYDGVTVRQILTMTSGVRWSEDYTDPNSDVASMYKVPPGPGEDATIAYLRTLPREAAPGSKWVYKTGETNLIGVLVSKATGKTLARYAEEKIWRPFGMERDLFWMVDAGGQDIGGCCISVSLRDYARIGEFVLADGMAGGKRVVPEGWFAAATHAQASTGRPGYGYGYQWWTNPDGSFQAQGIFGQLIYIDPARKLVIAMSGAWPKATDPVLGSARMAFVQSIVAATER